MQWPLKASSKAKRAGASGMAGLVEDVLAGWAAASAVKGGLASGKSAKPHRKTPPQKARRKSVRPAAAPHRGGKLEAVGWFLLAGAILAWPRREAIFDWSFLRPGRRDGSAHVDAGEAEALEPGRGRAARNPTEIPVRGWKDIGWRAWTDFNHDNIPQVAGGVAFFGILAIFPAMAAFVSLYGLFFDVSHVQHQLNLIAGIMPAEALALVRDQLIRLALAHHAGLGLTFVLGLLLSVWSANAGMKALIVGLNVAFEEREKRNLVKLNLVSLAFTLGALVFVLLAMGATVATPIVLAFIGYKGSVLALLRWPLLLLVAVGALGVLYRYAPSRAPGGWRWVTAGGGAAALLWLAASLLFSAYVAHFGSYDKTYGSLGAVIGFMSWIWISTITVLFGAEINSEIEHQTAVDTTTGAPLPMGLRGAHMADTLGEARPKKKATGEPAKPSVRPAAARRREIASAPARQGSA